MTYLEVVELIRSVAVIVNPTGDFIHGLRVDGSLNYDGNFPLILLEPVGNRPNLIEGLDNFNITIGFLFEDRADTTPAQREVIIGEADVLMRAFETELMTRSIDLSNVSEDSFYRIFSAILSGYLLRFVIGAKREECVED